MPLFTQDKQTVPSNLLRDKYGWPPFSILNTTSHDWLRRRDEWGTIIKDSTVGRDTKRYNATPTNIFSAHGKEFKKPESISSFDPYLCELMLRWFSKSGYTVLDPFSGGNVRGTVSAILGRNYIGVDLSPIQIEANQKFWIELQNKYTNISGNAQWLLGDSDSVLHTVADESVDMVFTCPPYYNLEIYTKDQNDLSRQPDYAGFLYKYGSILNQCIHKLKPDSFFVIVVSEIRASSHSIQLSQYQGLVPDTINLMRDFGMKYYNEIILMNSMGSLPIRAPKYFDKTRKIGRHHQNILVFYKGNIENIEGKFGEVSV